MIKLCFIPLFLFTLSVTSISCSSPTDATANKTTETSNDDSKSKDDAEKYNDAGIIKANGKNYSEAIEDFKKAIELNPNDARFYNNIASIKHSIHQDDNEALDYSNKAIELNPTVGTYYGVRAVINLGLGKLNDAQNDYIKAKQLGYNGD